VIRRSLLLALPALLLLAPAAAAQIVPQKGIAGIELTMTRAEVIAAKGKPDAEKIVKAEIIGPERRLRYGGTKVSFGGTMASAGVIGIRTVDPLERTGSGVGVGSSAAEVKAGVAGTKCITEFGFSHCSKGSFLPGTRVTDFLLDGPGGKVEAVVVGFVID